MRKFALLLTATLLFASFCGCSGEKKGEGSSQATTSETTSTTSANTTSESQASSSLPVSDGDGAINPLTGVAGYNKDALGKRPVAVMLNNIKAALPQYGIGDADILFEVVVEGGITRLMGVYADYTAMPDICSVRSCRYYYPIIASSFDAVYCHIGYEKTYAKAKLSSLGIDTISDTNTKIYNECFAVDEERKKTYATEHTKYLKGGELARVFEEYDYRTDIGDEFEGNYFTFNSSFTAPEGETAETLNLKFSGSYYSTFEYDASTQTYKKFHSGNEHIDGKTGEQLAFTNVLVIRTDVYPKPENTYLMNCDIVGSGTGLYFSGGKVAEMNWRKDSETSRFYFTDASGAPLKVNVGKNYIGILDYDNSVTYE